VDFVLSDASADLIADRIDVAIRGGVLEDSGPHRAPGAGCRAGWPGGQPGLHRGAGHALPACRSWLPTTAWCSRTPADVRPGACQPHDGTDVEVQVAGRLSGNTVQVLRKAALAGLGIALLPSTMTRRELRAGLLVPVLPQFHRKGHGVHLVYASRRHLPSAVQAFIELVVAKLGDFEDLPMKTPGTPA
jgi:DNA-binding transcriptional LysR family regulator